MKYDLSIASEQVVNDLNKKSKRWLVRHAQWLDLRRKQAVTDHAMEVSRLNTAIQTERKTVEHWKDYSHKCEVEAAAARNELQKVQGKCRNQEQIIRKLGDSISLAGEAIAHL